jgi:hypothetical protein
VAAAGLGDADRAVACFTEALALHRQVGDRLRESEALVHLGDAHAAAGDAAAAAAAWRGALGVLDEIGSPAADRLRDRLAVTAA